MECKELLHRCFRCGWCKFPMDFSNINCPSYLKYSFETYSPGGRLWLIRGLLNKEIEATNRFKEIVYSCATCKSCTVSCAIPEIKNYIVDMVIDARQDLVATGKLPSSIKNYFTEIYNNGNPFKKLQSERGKWADGLGVLDYKDQDYLFYVGNAGSFDEIAIKMTRAVASILIDVGVSFGILGIDETSDGNDVRTMGEQDLFVYLAEKNIHIFKERGVKKIITLSPHSFNVFQNDYPQFGIKFEVYHYTDVLIKYLPKLNLGVTNLKVTYHDPCYLGRWNNKYFFPRQILQSVPGITMLEMPRNQGSALCCGGGGGNYYSDVLGSGQMSPARVRIREAFATGADVIAVSCPICLKMLDDALKDEGLDDRIRVMDIAQILNESKAK